MRRLLPALITVLFFVVATAWFTVNFERRVTIATDVTAALFYVANWRFLLGDEGYFAALALPSPVRHTWSLSIEEQFYLGFPLMMAALGALSTRRAVHAWILGGLAAASALWMFLLFDPTVDPVRVYFGTDTRAFELFIGAVAAIVWRKYSFAGFSTFTTHFVHAGGWFGIAFVVLAMRFLPDDSAIPYRGGLVVFSLASMLAILAAASSPDTSFGKVFGLTPVRWVGLISYPLYLWHWPIIIMLDRQRMGFSGFPLFIFQAALSVLLAALTYQFIEKPIRLRRSLLPGQLVAARTIVVAAIPVLVLSTVMLAKTEQPFQTPTIAPGDAILLPSEVMSDSQYTAMFIGNSVPDSLAYGLGSTGQSPWMALHTNTYVGCDPLSGIRVNDQKIEKPSAECIGWRKRWPKVIKNIEPDVVVYFVPQSFLSDVIVDNKTLVFGTPAHNEYLRSGLDEIRRNVHGAGTPHLVVTNLSCHQVPVFDEGDTLSDRINDSAAVRKLNRVVTDWAEQNSVGVIDQYTALCPNDEFSSKVNGEVLYSDYYHFTKNSAPIVWAWMVPQLISFIEGS